MFHATNRLNVSDNNYMKKFAGAVARAIRNNISPELKLNYLDYCKINNDGIPGLVISLEQRATQNIGFLKFSLAHHQTLYEFIAAFNFQIAILNLILNYPQLGIASVTPESFGAFLIRDPRCQSDCLRVERIENYFDTTSFTLDTKCFARAMNETMKKYRQKPVVLTGMPAVIYSPLILTEDMIQHYNTDEILIAPYNPGYGNAVYISGADATLGNWKTAHRCHYDASKNIWFYRIDPNTEKAEYKFLLGPFAAAERVATQALIWENCQDRIIPGLDEGAYIAPEMRVIPRL